MWNTKKGPKCVSSHFLFRLVWLNHLQTQMLKPCIISVYNLLWKESRPFERRHWEAAAATKERLSFTQWLNFPMITSLHVKWILYIRFQKYYWIFTTRFCAIVSFRPKSLLQCKITWITFMTGEYFWSFWSEVPCLWMLNLC